MRYRGIREHRHAAYLAILGELEIEQEIAENRHGWSHTDEQYVLIENGLFEPIWVTCHHTPADAAAYHLGQEYLEDWNVHSLIDLDTGQRFDATHSLTWEPAL
jgi:hypothetical protein